jgi:hypothetical protein
MMLVKVFERVRRLRDAGGQGLRSGGPLDLFLFESLDTADSDWLPEFCRLDDTDVISAIKKWSGHDDKILALLCRSILDRDLYKLRLQGSPVPQSTLARHLQRASETFGTNPEDSAFLAFTGVAENSLYDPGDERINILSRDGTVRDISEVDDGLIHGALSKPVRKFYICHHRSIADDMRPDRGRV